MTFAPLPDHRHIDDSTRPHLLATHGGLLQSLRRTGWETDVELEEGKYSVLADLKDDTRLCITSTPDLPRQFADIEGWSVVRRSTGEGDGHTVLYDSTPVGAQRKNGSSLVPLFTRLEALEKGSTSERLWVSALWTSPTARAHCQAGPPETPGLALARYADWSHSLNSDGYQQIWANCDSEPVSLFERQRHFLALHVNRWHDVLPQ